MIEAALSAAQAVSYDSCGTVEFLLGSDNRFYFLEMNTRLQVEHPVTEEVWGVDLAAEMIRIALGEPLSEEIPESRPRGHAIECRIYAENPARGFAPSPGAITSLRIPSGPGVRADMGIEEGSIVPIDYDPMLGKLIAHGASRRESLTRLARALSEIEILGVETTLPLFRWLLSEPDFLEGRFDVQWLDRELERATRATAPARTDDLLLASVALASAETSRGPDWESETTSAWHRASRLEGLGDL